MSGVTKSGLATKLRALRDAVGLSQEVIARALEIPRTGLASIEEGKRDVTAIELIELCKIYRISPNDILRWKQDCEEDDL